MPSGKSKKQSTILFSSRKIALKRKWKWLHKNNKIKEISKLRSKQLKKLKRMQNVKSRTIMLKVAFNSTVSELELLLIKNKSFKKNYHRQKCKISLMQNHLNPIAHLRPSSRNHFHKSTLLNPEKASMKKTNRMTRTLSKILYIFNKGK